jgi:hypothetical protein
MAETIDFRLGRVPDIRLPIGANFSAAFTFTGIDLTGYTATLAAQNQLSRKARPVLWSKSGITVGAAAISFDIAPATVDDDSVAFDVTTAGFSTGYSLTVFEAGVIVMRMQGEIEWIPEVGDFTTTTAAATAFSVAVADTLAVAVAINGVSGIQVANSAAATDAASTQALANALRQALIDFGIMAAT